MMKEICSKDSCTGCAACVNVCPRSCIKMQEDKWGYINLVVDDSQCTDCGLCARVCPSNKTVTDSFVPHKCYAAWSLDAEKRDHMVLLICASQRKTVLSCWSLLRKVKTLGLAERRDICKDVFKRKILKRY